MGESAPKGRITRRLCYALALAVPLSFGVAHVVTSGSSDDGSNSRDVITATTYESSTPQPGKSAAGLLSLPSVNALKASLRHAAQGSLPSLSHPGAQPAVIDETRHQRIADVSANTSYDVPRAALNAYQNAAKSLASSDPGCHLSWGVLAAIGQVESDQGRYGGAKVLADGTTFPTIVGMQLDGVGKVARIPDTDNGRLDGDKVWDRAVGPMQFIPSTWATVGTDGDGNGTRNPNDFDDAALATAQYLCAGGGDMRVVAQARRAVFSYNHSADYVTLVLTIAERFDGGTVTVVSNSATPTAAQRRTQEAAAAAQARRDARAAARHHHAATRHHHKPAPGPDPSPTPTPTPHHHKPKPHHHKPAPHHHQPKPHHHKPKPHHHKPKPPPPPPPPLPPPVVTTTLTGVFTTDENGVWSVDGTPIDLGTANLDLIQGDYDGDGTAESVADELDGLQLQGVDSIIGSVGLEADGLVVTINNLAFDPNLVLMTPPPRPQASPTPPSGEPPSTGAVPSTPATSTP
jgi:hypothetical protein